jgi:hypothetical protein
MSTDGACEQQLTLQLALDVDGRGQARGHARRSLPSEIRPQQTARHRCPQVLLGRHNGSGGGCRA